MQQGCWCWYDALSSSGAMFCMRNVGGVDYIVRPSGRDVFVSTKDRHICYLILCICLSFVSPKM